MGQRNVQWQVFGRAQHIEHTADLDVAAAAQFDQGGVAAEALGNLGPMGTQQADLGAGRVVLGLPGNGIEQA